MLTFEEEKGRGEIHKALDKRVEKVAAKGFEYLKGQYKMALYNAWYYKQKCKPGEDES